jgi:CheY-like chemotaxis protein
MAKLVTPGNAAISAGLCQIKARLLPAAVTWVPVRPRKRSAGGVGAFWMDWRQHLVLLVDDDRAVREALQFSLQLQGLRVRIHCDGPDLLADPELARARCVVLDDRNPRMDAFALLNHLKARDIAVPSILLSNYVTTRIRARAKAAGVRTVLEKPLLDDALLDHIRTIIGCGPEAPAPCV